MRVNNLSFLNHNYELRENRYRKCYYWSILLLAQESQGYYTGIPV